MKPAKLQAGDEIRIISPSMSLGVIAEEQIVAATKKLEAFGFTVSFPSMLMKEMASIRLRWTPDLRISTARSAILR